MKKYKTIIAVFISIIILSFSEIVEAQSNIIFSDKKLEASLYKYYNWKETFTITKARELSKEKNNIFLNYAEISNLEGLQYFDNLIAVNLEGNNLSDLKPLAKMKNIELMNISDNSIKGKKFQNILCSMGSINKLEWIRLYDNNLDNITFLKKIGNINNYTALELDNNIIKDISILKYATKLEFFDVSNNRITDVLPLKDLENLTYLIDLRDNCIIDYKPIKHLFDKMYEEFDSENGMDRYDFYTNPVNFKYNDKKIDFPYLTVYYKYQAYAEATPLFKSFGGSAEYDKKSGTLTCKYDGNVLVFKDFSRKYTLNGKEKSLKYPMRRMQYDLAYVPVKEICEVLGLEYNITKTRAFYLGNDEYEYAPKLVEISKDKKELG